MALRRRGLRRFWPFGKRKPKPQFRGKVFPSTEFPILERARFERGWQLLERTGGEISEEGLRTVLQEWGKKENVSANDARKLFGLWGVREEIIERVVKAYSRPK